MKSFLEDIALYYASLGTSLEQYCFILPSKRAGTFLKNHLKETMSATIFAPKITSIEVFVGELANLAYLSDEEQLFRLYKLYLSMDSDPKDSFADFSSWATILLNDFSEIDQYLVDANKLFSYLEEYKKLSEWNPSGAPNGLLTSYSAFWNSLLPLYSALTESLLEEQLGTRGMIYRRAAKEVSTYVEQHAKTKFVFVGFNALNKAEEVIIQQFLAKGNTQIHWDIDSYFLNDDYHDAGLFIRNYQSQWAYLKAHGLKGVSDYIGKQKKSIELIGLPMNVAQAQYTGELLSNMTPDQLSKTALILGVEEQLNLVLNALPKELSPNITMGYSIQHSNVASFMALLFEIHRSATSASYRATDCYTLLLHPLSKLLCRLKYHLDVDEMVYEMRRKNHSYWSLKELKSLRIIAADFFQLVFAKELNKPKGFIAAVQELLMEFKALAAQENNDLIQTNCLFMTSLFSKLQLWITSYDFVNSITALEQLYERMLSKTQNYFKGEALDGLQIMGMLESRNLDFETVILTNLNEGILPGGKKQNSHLPYQLKRMYGLPTYKERDAIFTYHFYRLLQRSKKLYLIYNIEPEILEGGEPSRFIAQLESDPILKKYLRKKIISPSLNSIQKQPLSILKSKQDCELISAKLQDKTSPTLLTTYLRNPIDFYEKYLLKVADPPQLDAQIPHHIFGTIVHDSLEALYRGFVGEFLDAQKLQNLFPEVNSIVSKHYEKNYVTLDYNSGKNIIAFEVIARYVSSYIQADIQLIKKQQIKLIALEEAYQMPFELNELGITLMCHGTFDRVEERDGILTIIDYKTGKVLPTELKLKSWEDLTSNYKVAKQFQLLFYSMIYMDQKKIPQLQAGIFSFKSIKNGLMLFAQDKETLITAQTISLFKEQLKALVTELLDPKHPFIEKTP